MAGPKKAPAGTDRRIASGVSRAQSGARTAPALTRPPAQGRARRIRAQKGSRRSGKPGGGGADGRERNGTRWRERYAGTEPQSFSGGMRNMTCHDTMQGVFREPPASASEGGRRRSCRAAGVSPLPACGGDMRPPPSRAQSGARTAPAQDARWRARARTQDTRAKRVPPLESAQAGGGADGRERNGTRRRSDMQERNRRASAMAWRT